MAIQLEQGKTYQVKVLSIESKKSRPSYPYKGGTWYNYMMIVQILKGEEGMVEFASEHPEVDSRLPFIIGVVQWMKCKQCSENGCNVEAWDPEPAPVSRKEIAEDAMKLVDKNYKPPAQNGPSNFNERFLFFTGAWAKDFMVAEIANRPKGYVVDEAQTAERWGKLTGLMYDQLVGLANEKSKDF